MTFYFQRAFVQGKPKMLGQTGEPEHRAGRGPVREIAETTSDLI